MWLEDMVYCEGKEWLLGLWRQHCKDAMEPLAHIGGDQETEKELLTVPWHSLVSLRDHTSWDDVIHI